MGKLINAGMQVQRYAHDIVLICRFKHKDTLCERIQTDLKVQTRSLLAAAAGVFFQI